MFFLSINNSIQSENLVNLTILQISDLDGWLNPHDEYGGVASYMGFFKEEGFDTSIENSSFLLLSSGDQNTGPATVTRSKGKEAVIDVMNAMVFFFPVNLPSFSKFIIISVIGAPLIFLMSFLIRKTLPFTTRILG